MAIALVMLQYHAVKQLLLLRFCSFCDRFT